MSATIIEASKLRSFVASLMCLHGQQVGLATHVVSDSNSGASEILGNWRPVGLGIRGKQFGAGQGDIMKKGHRSGTDP